MQIQELERQVEARRSEYQQALEKMKEQARAFEHRLAVMQDACDEKDKHIQV